LHVVIYTILHAVSIYGPAVWNSSSSALRDNSL